MFAEGEGPSLASQTSLPSRTAQTRLALVTHSENSREGEG